MMVLDRGLDDGRRRLLAIQIERMTSFGHRPAVVVAFLDKKRLLPEILAVLSDPDVAGLFIDRHSPRVAQAHRPNLGRAPCKLTKGLSFGTEYVFPGSGLRRSIRRTLASSEPISWPV